MKHNRSAIALLITLMFVIVITVAIAYGLKQVNDATKIVKEENFLYQKSIIVEDILNILKNSPELQASVENNSSANFFRLLSQASFIPFEYEGIEIFLSMKSARAKFNPAMLDEPKVTLLRQYLSNHNVNSQYVDILLDNIRGIKEDNSYNSNIFDENPYLFRDYIASTKHLEIINDYYTKEYNDNSLEDIDFNALFYYGSNTNISIDINYATPEVWEFMLNCSRNRAEFLSAGGGYYTSFEDLNLNDDEKEILTKNFKSSFFEPIIEINLEITLNGQHSKMSFEYDIKKKKGSNFAYEI
ncbi:hypothetical protein JHD46_00835 [Sulfurimonas sp. SAG-AH-194-C20]|nr:hypothetical protein [Sulfurimonas sp. SAG-AH-194-C20]MDF1878177.1 hypothetical protein [Sulfurimonas sp. SAG-AH-194-C20]